LLKLRRALTLRVTSSGHSAARSKWFAQVHSFYCSEILMAYHQSVLPNGVTERTSE
jgi:hypothetical protein